MVDTRIHPAAALRPHHRRPQKCRIARGRTITWTSYNMPASITQGARTVSFQHDDNHQRIKQVSTDGTTLYIKAFSVTAELFGVGTGAARWNDYLSMGNVQVGMRVTEVAAQTVSTRYFHTDHLGSVTVITNESAVVVERLSFDAWGKRRYPNGTDDPTGVISSQTNRGFTGHEELDAVALVHMNGRVYDPLVGRMISADPTVPDPMNAQAWNRYSYVGNDPLAFTDPSGFNWFSNFFRSIANFLTNNPIVRAIVQIAITVVLTAVIMIPVIGPVIAASASAFIVTGLSGGNLGQMLRAGAIAGATAFAFAGLNMVAPAQAFGADFNPVAYAQNVAGSALVGCASSAASGGSCASGAAGAAVSAGLAPATNRLFPNAGSDIGQRIGGTIVQATAGGVASVAGGGNFANGAVTAAFQYNVALGPLDSRMDARAEEINPPPGRKEVPWEEAARLKVEFLIANPSSRLFDQDDGRHYAAFWNLPDALRDGVVFILPPTDRLPERLLLQNLGTYQHNGGPERVGVYEYIVIPGAAGGPMLTHSTFMNGKGITGYPSNEQPK